MVVALVPSSLQRGHSHIARHANLRDKLTVVLLWPQLSARDTAIYTGARNLKFGREHHTPV